MRIIVIGLLLFSIAACNNTSKVQKGQEAEKTTFFTKDSLALSIERTLCFGMCPAYKITVNNKGEALYDGYKFTDRLGKYTAKVSQDQYNQVLEKAKAIGFFDMKEQYDNEMVTDLPSTIILVSGPEGSLEVTDRYDAPEELKELEKLMDKILLNLDWQKADQ